MQEELLRKINRTSRNNLVPHSEVSHQRRLAHLEEVDDEGEDVAHEEDEDDDHEHGGHPDLALLHARQLSPLGVGTPGSGFNSAQVRIRDLSAKIICG